MFRFLAALALCVFAVGSASAQVRIKDITEVAGAPSNQLVGFGLVVGLDGTGSRSTFTQQVAVDMLQRMGTTTQIFSQLPAESVLRSTNISAVMVVAELGPFARKAGRLDVTVSALDDARSLQGGTLIRTPLYAVDGQAYVVAQGQVSVGGFAIAGQAAGIQKNHLNVGRIPEGGIVVKESLGDVAPNGRTQLLVKDPDFNTARLIAKAINDRFPGTAGAIDPGAVVLCIPPDPKRTPTQFLAELGLIEVTPDVQARVVINERTGTVVTGEHVTITSTAVSHGNLYLGVAETPAVSQPAPLGGGTTAVVPRTQIAASEQRSRLVVLPKATTVAEVARALNALGVTPRDLISIFQALKRAGALHADIIII